MFVTIVMILANVAMAQHLTNVTLVTIEPTCTKVHVSLYALKITMKKPLVTLVKDVMDLVPLAMDQHMTTVILVPKDYTSILTHVLAHVLMEPTKKT